jgi:hypothetical protein
LRQPLFYFLSRIAELRSFIIGELYFFTTDERQLKITLETD